MNTKRHNKATSDRKKLESALISDLSPLSAQGTHLSSCMASNALNKKYDIAKKRYIDLLDHAEKTIKTIKDLISKMEKDAIKEQKRDKLIEEDEMRNKAIKGEDLDPEPKHRKGWW